MRSRDKMLKAITYDPFLEATAQRFAEELAQTPGDEIWHSKYNTRGLENVSMNPKDYRKIHQYVLAVSWTQQCHE